MKSARIILQKGKLSDVVLRSLSPEMDRKIPRTKVDFKEEGENILIEIQAQDVNALRAAINSYMRWMKVSMDTCFEAENKYSQESRDY
jgi:tRNA threonylcarbamoyladenosine modification (KEOPS) complex  Pcc1 subunit